MLTSTATSISVDYFRIELKNQISSLSTTDLNQRCEDSGGTDPLCAFIVRPFPFANRTPANFPSTISTVPFNQASLITQGIDYEVNYKFALGEGQMGLRVLGNYTPVLTTRTSSAANVIPVLSAGVAGTGLPRHKITGSIDFSQGGLHLGADLKYIDAMFYTRQANVFVTNNRLPPVAYLNANISYDFELSDKRSLTLFVSGTNLTDHFVFAPQNNAQPTEFYPSFQSQYDVVGRYFVIGARVRL